MPSTRSTLLQFHESHFLAQSLPPLSHPTLGFPSEGFLRKLESTKQTDDVLGYYDDGVKRTLSDEQVAIFRHTEIQELLRDKRERAGCAAAFDRIDTGSPAQDSFAEYGDPSSTLQNKTYETNQGQGLADKSKRHDDCLSRAQKNHSDSDDTEKDLNPALPVEHPSNVIPNPCVRKVTSYEDDNFAQIKDQPAAALSGEGVVRSKFAWPELRH